MKNLTLENITKVCNGTYHGPQEKLQEEVTAITTDSRKVEKGGLFVPVVGERVDAHRFIPQVMEAGALATLSEEGYLRNTGNHSMLSFVFLFS